VWDGRVWQPIAPSAITTYPTDADVFNDTAAAPGTYGTSIATGNLFIRTSGGVWRQVGIRSYPNETAMQADTTVADGSVAVTLAEDTVWLRVAGTWRALNAISYTTEALLLASTRPDGVIGLAQDTGLVYARMNGGWRRVNSPTTTVAAARPATPAVGDFHVDNVTGATEVWIGTTWASVTSDPIGEVKFFAGQRAAVPANFLVCDGSPIPAGFPRLIALIGANTPNLIDQFVRGGNPEAGFTRHQDTTRLPRNAFTTSNPGDHNHGYTGGWGNGYPDGSGDRGGDYPVGSRLTNAGGHTHTIGGGDSETAPVHVRLLPIIRAA
jgi:hypothetical protein